MGVMGWQIQASAQSANPSLALTPALHYPFNTPLVHLRSQAGVDSNIMSTTKPVIPVTNLKERIAALEQKNAAERSTSPSPATGATAAAGGSALKDRIAKFEKKGAVPAPRGRFGLGAPPPPDGQIKRNGELYGNRIPQPVRFGSQGSQPPSRSGSSIGFNSGSPEMNFNDLSNRRSFSVSSATSDDEALEYSPMIPPAYGSPPSSPESTLPPEASPTLSTTSDGSAFRQPIRRAAPFAQVLETARKASENTEVLMNINDPLSPTPFVNSKRIVMQADVENGEPTVDANENPASPQSPTPAVITEEPDSITDSPVEDKSAPIAAPTIVVQSPAPNQSAFSSPVPAQQLSPVTPPSASPADALATPAGVTSDSRPLPSTPAVGESEKPKNRNNKDLTLKLEEAEAAKSPTIDDDTTPTTANHLLSPMPNSAASSVFTGSSYGSGGSSMISPRPFSMIDITLAERVTPATGRGNIVFVPPSTATMPRKSDLVYFPPTPTEETNGMAGAQAGAAPKSSQPTSFSAVVHGKVRETADPIPHPAPLVPQTPSNRRQKEDKKWKRMTMIAQPSTPATGELASLIHNAVILENMVEKGELPWEAELREERERERREREQERQTAIAAERAKAAAEDAKRQAALQAALAKQREREKAREQAEREEEEFATNKLRHTFLIPLSQAQNEQQQSHRKDGSTSTIDANSHRKTMVEKSSTKSPRARASDIPPTEVPEVPHLPSKSPSISSSKSRFSSFNRRMKSAISGRPSTDVSVYEDRLSIDSGHSVDEFGNSPHGHGKESSWPALSPTGKKTVGRAASFAGQLFSRSKKSNSSLASESEKAHQSMYTLPPLPDFIPQTQERVEAPKGPRRSTSLKSLRGLMKKHVPPPMDIPPLPQPQAESANDPTVVSPSSAGSPSSILSSPGPLKSPDYIGFGTMYPPADPHTRPMSVMSASSLTSNLPSPLFEEDIFSKFPAVPSHTTGPPQTGASVSAYGLTPVPVPSAALGTPSFDSSLLSSALHLKSKVPKSQATPQPR